jgi:hypothetical protein
MQLQPEGTGRCLHLLGVGLGNSGIGWIDEQGHDAHRGEQLVQQLQPLRRCLQVQLGCARDVAARLAEARDKAKPNRVRAQFKDDRNGRGRRLCRKRCRSCRRSNHGHMTMNQVSRHRRQPVMLVLRPAIFDCDVAAIDVTGLAQPFEKGRQLWRVVLGRSDVETPDHRHRRLLRTRRKRPCCRSTAEKCDELAPLHVSPVRTTPCAMAKA